MYWNNECIESPLINDTNASISKASGNVLLISVYINDVWDMINKHIKITKE